MAYQVKIAFHDAVTNKPFKVGDNYPADTAEERLNLLIAKGYITEGAGKPTEKNTVDEIKKYLADNGIEYDESAKKADLLALVEE